MSTVVLVTRPASRSGPLIRALRDRGYGVRAVPTVATVAPTAAQRADLDAALLARDAFDWIIVTSPEGALRVTRRIAALQAVLRPGPDPRRWAAVGPGTVAALEAGGIVPAAVPERSVGAAIAGAIERVDGLAGRRILLVRGDIAGRDLPAILRASGASVTELVAYRTVEGPVRSARRAREALDDPALGTITFASGSAVRGLVALLDRSRLERARDVPAVTIGPSTSAVAAAHGFTRTTEASAATPGALAAAVDRALGRPDRHLGSDPNSIPAHMEHAS